MLSPSLAKISGLKLGKGRPKMFRCLGGEITASVHRIQFSTDALYFHARVGLPAEEMPNVVGRLDVMKSIDVIFIDERELSDCSCPLES